MLLRVNYGVVPFQLTAHPPTRGIVLVRFASGWLVNNQPERAHTLSTACGIARTWADNWKPITCPHSDELDFTAVELADVLSAILKNARARAWMAKQHRH